MLVPLRLFAVTLVVVVSLVAASCGGDDEEEGAPAGGTAADTAAAEAAAFDLKIGAVLPLTGDLASFGPSQAEAARIAVEQIEDVLSSKGLSDVTVELVGVEDDQASRSRGSRRRRSSCRRTTPPCCSRRWPAP